MDPMTGFVGNYVSRGKSEFNVAYFSLSRCILVAVSAVEVIVGAIKYGLKLSATIDSAARPRTHRTRRVPPLIQNYRFFHKSRVTAINIPFRRA